MKRFLVVLVLVVLIVPQQISSAPAAVKTGSPCTKLASTSILNSLKFICLKSGKKLIWGKGVKFATLTPTPTPTPTPTKPVAKFFSKIDTASHNKESDCWTYVDGKVYDITVWLPQHPGGSEIVLAMCGTDGAPSFRGQHQKDQDSALAGYYIGELK